MAKAEFDMSQETARASLELAFRSPSPHLKIEFQGGEPLLNFELLRWIVAEAKSMNERHGKHLAFVIATNLALLDDAVLEFCEQEGVDISTSLDGPEDLHNANRRRPGQDSWQKAVDGIRAVQARLGPDRVSALMTTTEASLGRVRDIVDTYVGLGLNAVFLRPISPYGFALRSKGGAGYGVRSWLDFYNEGLDYIIDLNRRGIPMLEVYTAIIAKKIWTNTDPGYVDLTSPAGIGIGALVYNYDGDIYASDEGRMLAEMNDHTFKLGNVHADRYADILLSDKLIAPLQESFALSAPKCTTCAFEPYCGADPVFHHATMGDVVGHKAFSEFCERNTGVFTVDPHPSPRRRLHPPTLPALGRRMIPLARPHHHSRMVGRPRRRRLEGRRTRNATGQSTARMPRARRVGLPAARGLRVLSRVDWSRRRRFSRSRRTNHPTTRPPAPHRRRRRAVSAPRRFDGQRPLEEPPLDTTACLLTEQCDNYCLMCSQPPKDRDDTWLFDRAHKVIDLLPPDARSHRSHRRRTYSARRPSAAALLDHCRTVAPHLQLHLLSNGRRFSDPDYAIALRRRRQHEDIMVGIPVYAPEPTLHDFVVQAPGAFDETIRGILNLAALRSAHRDPSRRPETHRPRTRRARRLHRPQPALRRASRTHGPRNDRPGQAQHSTRSGSTRSTTKPNSPKPLKSSTSQNPHPGLQPPTVRTRPRTMWPYAVQSISDWKNDYHPICTTCEVKDHCAGIFTTGSGRVSRGLAPVSELTW